MNPGAWTKRWWTAETRSVLLWCLPALVLGFVLRAALWLKMPHAFYHADSEQVFVTLRAALHGTWRLHEKKTALGPLLYCLPTFLHLPVLPTLALVQHLCGLGVVAMVGALVAGSFRFWRVFIIPVTVFVACNPVLLWYEHVALPESFYVFAIVAIALTGLLYVFRQSYIRLGALAVALLAVSGLRPEGSLFCLFGITLGVAVNWGRWRSLFITTAVFVGVTIFSFALNGTRQGGSLLYSNVAHLTPAHLWIAPGFAETNADYFAGLRGKWAILPLGDIPRERKRLFTLVRDYMESREGAERVRSENINQLCARLGFETCLRNWYRLPGLALAKFRFALRNSAAGDFGPHSVHDEQQQALSGGADESDLLADTAEPQQEIVRVLYGHDLDSREELGAFLHETYRPFSPDWLSWWQDFYSDSNLAVSLPDQELANRKELPGMPLLYIASVAGLILLALRRRDSRSYHLLWLGMLLFMAFFFALTGSNLGRFRIGFEPFWLLYALAVFDVALSWMMRRKAGLPA